MQLKQEPRIDYQAAVFFTCRIFEDEIFKIISSNFSFSFMNLNQPASDPNLPSLMNSKIF